MVKKRVKDYTKKIIELNINGLNGRMLYAPSFNKHKGEILLIYGHHSSIERMLGFAEELNKYGSITMPDLPGFGGMESFYKIHEKPTLDNLADYLLAFIKLRFKKRKITIIGMSFGFVIATRMLQKYPEITKQVSLIISVVGFAHKDDFILPKRIKWPLQIGASIFSNKYPALLLKTFGLRKSIIKYCYLSMANHNSKLKDADIEERNKRIEFEIKLWQINDIRTYMDTGLTMFKLNNCNVQVDLPIYHIVVNSDRYFDNHRVEQHLAIIYNKVNVINSDQSTHAPTVVATAKEASVFVPPEIRKLLLKKL